MRGEIQKRQKVFERYVVEWGIREMGSGNRKKHKGDKEKVYRFENGFF